MTPHHFGVAPPAAHPVPPVYDGDGLTAPALGFADVTCYSVDGSGNDPSAYEAGAAGSVEARLAPAQFAPGTAATPVDGPNPRAISNAIMANDPNTNDPGGRSAYMYAFGQFVDHDLDLTPDQTPNGTNTLSFAAPQGDPFFAPGTAIGIVRAAVDPATGNAVNAVTGFLDLSQVYGSDAATAASLRNADGTLKTSAGGNLPIVGGQFMGGDVRAAENPDLTSLDVLFVREHNRWVATLHAERPSLTGDELYQMARSITIAEYQHIVYSEFLPHLLGSASLAPYAGYDPGVTPVIFEEFAGAAYRFGHSIVSPVETKIGNDGTVLAQQDLFAAAGEPLSAFGADGGADALLRNLGQDSSQQEGVHLNADLLDMLNANPPGDVGDLGAIDVERERDLGLPTLNGMRAALGLPEYTSFAQITADPALAAKLASVYGSVNAVDLFVGGLAEAPVAGGMVGPTFAAIIAKQFATLRDGDRLFYLNQGFAPELLHTIETTTLSGLIERDTNTAYMQPDAFIATERHASDVASPDPTKAQLVIGVDAPGAVIAATPGVANTLVAGAGLHQLLVGGGTADRFVFMGTGHQDTVQNFQTAHDVIEIDTQVALTWRDVAITRGAAGEAVLHAAGDVIDLPGVSPAALGPANLVFETNPHAGGAPALDPRFAPELVHFGAMHGVML